MSYKTVAAKISEKREKEKKKLIENELAESTIVDVIAFRMS